MTPHPSWALLSPAAFPTCGCPYDPQNVGSDTPDQLSSPPYQSSDFLLGVWHCVPGLPLVPTQLPSSPHLGRNTTLQVTPTYDYLPYPASGLVFLCQGNHALSQVHLRVGSLFSLPGLWQPTPVPPPWLWSSSGFDSPFPHCRHTAHPVWPLLPHARLPHHGEPSYPVEALALHAGHFSPSLGSSMLFRDAPWMGALFTLCELWHLTLGCLIWTWMPFLSLLGSKIMCWASPMRRHPQPTQALTYATTSADYCLLQPHWLALGLKFPEKERTKEKLALFLTSEGFEMMSSFLFLILIIYIISFSSWLVSSSNLLILLVFSMNFILVY